MRAAPVYIAFEGSEGSGKSTHAARLAATLGALATRETGGTVIGRSSMTPPSTTSTTAQRR
jgi:thymidylate kinase